MPQVLLFPKRQAVFADTQFPGDLRLGLAAVNHQLYCLALKLLVVSLLNLLLFHELSHFTLSFRVRQIRGSSTVLAAILYSGMLFGSHLGVFPINVFFALLVGFMLECCAQPRETEASALNLR